MGTETEKAMRAAIAPLNFTLVGLHVLSVTFPPQFERAIMETEVAQQTIEQAQYQQSTRVIEAVTKYKKAEIDAATHTYVQNRNAEVAEMGLVASAQRVQYGIETLADALHLAKTKLGYSSNEDLLTFHWLYSMQQAGAKNLLYDMPAPQALTQAGKVSMVSSPAAGAAVAPLIPMDMKVEFSTTYNALKTLEGSQADAIAGGSGASDQSTSLRALEGSLRELGGVELEVRAGGVGEVEDMLEEERLRAESAKRQRRLKAELRIKHGDDYVKKMDGMNLDDLVQRLSDVEREAEAATDKAKAAAHGEATTGTAATA